MRKLIISSLVLFSMFVAGIAPTNAQTYELAKKTQVEKALSTADGAQIKKVVDKYSKMYGVDPALVYAVILTESGFNKYAKSPCGASGLMQLMPITFKARNVGTSIYSIEHNIHAGIKHLAGLNGRYKGDTVRVLAAYNMGGGCVPIKGAIPKVGKKYANRVMYHKKIIETYKII